MPAFEALLTAAEIEQVVDYVTFLSLRGDTELALIEEGFIADDEDEDALEDDIVDELVQSVLGKWADAEDAVVDPPVPRTPSSPGVTLSTEPTFTPRIRTSSPV